VVELSSEVAACSGNWDACPRIDGATIQANCNGCLESVADELGSMGLA